MFTRVDGSNPTEPDQTHPEIELLWDYFDNYPYSVSSDWTPIANVFKRLDIDEKIGYYLIEESGLKNQQGWDEKFQLFGMLMQSKILERDSATGYQGLFELTLVSDHGARFFEQFFEQFYKRH